ncbi:hypothetical protein KG892_02485 [Vermiphilus pyriformis]|nr:MAG: hypothetical protein KG892_02485 [Vermiphilus pyriformis]
MKMKKLYFILVCFFQLCAANPSDTPLCIHNESQDSIRAYLFRSQRELDAFTDALIKFREIYVLHAGQPSSLRVELGRELIKRELPAIFKAELNPGEQSCYSFYIGAPLYVAIAAGRLEELELLATAVVNPEIQVLRYKESGLLTQSEVFDQVRTLGQTRARD